ncbi:MAG: exopolysaccharide biosynthesis protein [Verrucomicrobia bacterium]|nr:exopolysaccharide biosynthesis protein [Verrucomicrobiota bacterium]
MATDAEREPAGTGAGAPPSLLSGQSGPPATSAPRKLSDDLAAIVREFEIETVTLREVMAVLHGRGFLLLIMLLALPFSTPLPLPGLSTPFGFVIALIGLRLVLGQKPWLPVRLLDTELSPKLFVRVFAATRKIMSAIEFFLKPRLPWLTDSTVLRQVHAVPIFLAGLLLLLPLPVPFSNSLPAITILLVAAGLLERDGLIILAGYIAFAGTIIFFGLLGFAGIEGLDAIKKWLAS